jgi:hypothetical protein
MGFADHLAQAAVRVKRNNTIDKMIDWMVCKMEEDDRAQHVSTPSNRLGRQPPELSNPTTPTGGAAVAAAPSKVVVVKSSSLAPYNKKGEASVLCSDLYLLLLSFLDYPALVRCGALSRGWRTYLEVKTTTAMTTTAAPPHLPPRRRPPAVDGRRRRDADDDDGGGGGGVLSASSSPGQRVWDTALRVQFGDQLAAEAQQWYDGASALERLWKGGWRSVGFSRDDLDGSISAIAPFDFTQHMRRRRCPRRRLLPRSEITKNIDSDGTAVAGSFPLSRYGTVRYG